MAKTSKRYMAIDQYGQTFLHLTHPRTELCQRLGRRHANKMYIDTIDGRTKHIGYVIGGLWLTLYEMRPYEQFQGLEAKHGA
jgi:hypothetical protein